MHSKEVNEKLQIKFTILEIVKVKFPVLLQMNKNQSRSKSKVHRNFNWGRENSKRQAFKFGLFFRNRYVRLKSFVILYHSYGIFLNCISNICFLVFLLFSTACRMKYVFSLLLHLILEQYRNVCIFRSV